MLFKLCFRHETLVVFVAVEFTFLVCFTPVSLLLTAYNDTPALLVEVHRLQKRSVSSINTYHTILVSGERWWVSTFGKGYRP